MANLYGHSPFEVLGVGPGADAEAVRSAYRLRVKECHPDQFSDEEKRSKAQEELIRLNLAYEEALKILSQHKVGFNMISQEEAKHFAQRLLDQGNLESALRQLNRADAQDEGWFILNGKILMGLRRYEEAEISFRRAIRHSPDNREYRSLALDAAIAQRESKKLNVKLQNWFKDSFGKR
ncbi:MAG: tetratricopeptide repeat protein [Clostridiales bacterium]|nr:tetratricopeptide repeat protein [Clostridiales bacterium]